MTDTRTRDRIQFLVREIRAASRIIDRYRSRITLATLAGLQPDALDVQLLDSYERQLNADRAELAALTFATSSASPADVVTTEQEGTTP
jgi:hypothetical protein